MNALLDELETQWRDSLMRWLADHLDMSAHARIDLDDRPGAAPAAWKGLADDLGLLGMGLPEAQGGLGGGLRSQLLVLDALGEHLAAEPYLSAALIGGGLLQRSSAAAASACLEQLVAGSALVAWAHAEPDSRGEPLDVRCTLQPQGAGWRLQGRKSLVQAAPWATQFVVSAREAGSGQLKLLLVDANTPGLLRRDVRVLDGGWASELAFHQVSVAPSAVLYEGAAAEQALERILDEATLGVCAEALGAMRRLMADSVAHLRERKQFGVPLASFQVLQHRLADMHIQQELAESITWAAADALSADQDSATDRALTVSSAKVTVGRAIRAVGQGAVQFHGAMGITEELAAARFFRRATQIELMFGATLQHLRRIDRLL